VRVPTRGDRELNVFKNYVIVERGPLAIHPETFDLTKCYGPRATALLPD
jgi:hypothetical protein